jgi:hypothetical protein
MLRKLLIGSVVSLALASAGCGSSSPLQSISVSPAQTAGPTSVQLVATGVYVDGKKVTPLAVTWTNYDPAMGPPPSLPTGWPTISSTGLAQCGPIPAMAAFWGSLLVNPPPGEGVAAYWVSGSAQLNCP